MKVVDYSYFIERYIAGEMNDEEKKWFQKELEVNEELRDEVNLRRQTDVILKNQNVISLRKKLSGIEKNREVNLPVRKVKRPVALKYAALIATLVLIGSITFFTGKNLSNEDLITKFYKTYEPPATQRSVQSETNSDFSLAIDYYNAHDFEQAAIFFNKVLASNPGDMQSELLSGIANFEDKKYPEAKQSFIKVIDDNDNLFIESAKWYLALCYIKTNEKDKAIQQLKIINNEGGIYRSDAIKIIRKLK
jgi:tetratricopeptide (TPR) repeat protein